MIVEVEGKRYELSWEDIAILLALLWVRGGVLTLSHLSSIGSSGGDLEERLGKLREEGLVGVIDIEGNVFIHLTDDGYKVARRLEKLAREIGDEV